MSAEAFIDTNVFIYQLDTRDARKSAIAERIIWNAIEMESACTSFQVVQETLHTMLRKAEITYDANETRAYLDTVLAPLVQISAALPLYQRALDLQTRYRYAFYDSLIVAAALTAGCSRLYTEDMQHGHQIEGLRIENPFL
jgi:predicted nucleic acid-binding protein